MTTPAEDLDGREDRQTLELIALGIAAVALAVAAAGGGALLGWLVWAGW